VPSHDRPHRLRWLLNALQEQTLPRDAFEVIVCHDSKGPETAELLESHPIQARHIQIPAGSGPPGLQRNRAWRAAAAPLIAFTDDDCRPPEQWLQNALTAAEANPGQIVQGKTRPDPDELGIALHAPHARSQSIDPPVPWAQTCNIIYPRELLAAVNGFDERMEGGEDCELAQRALHAGARLIGAPEVLTYHAVHASGLAGLLKSLPRWQHLAGLFKRHGQLRSELTAGIFWRETHALVLLAAAGALAARRRPAAALLILPWALKAAPHYGPGARGRLRAATELPGRAVIDLAEIAVLARGSVRYRTILL
jgi:hypothetical protein